MTWTNVENNPALHFFDAFAVPEHGFSSPVCIFESTSEGKLSADSALWGLLRFVMTLPSVTSEGSRFHDGDRKYDLRIEAMPRTSLLLLCLISLPHVLSENSGVGARFRACKH